MIILSNGFEIAHGDLEIIKERLSNPSVWGTCVVATDLKTKALDDSYKIDGSNKTFLIQQGLLADDGSMSDEVRNVILVAYELKAKEGLEQVSANVCIPPVFARLESI